MVHLTQIYTRTGDNGTTGLSDFSRVPKTDPRLVAYADVDEANSSIGLALALAGQDTSEDVRALLLRIQNDLFDVGADLATPLLTAYRYPPLRTIGAWVTDLEKSIDFYNADLATLDSFILPGGSPLAAGLHVARTVVRRAERSTWAAIEAYGSAPADPNAPEGSPAGGVNGLAAQYLNRLSDLLFVLARYANVGAATGGDVKWVPSASRTRMTPDSGNSDE
jgi:cob(I)alamin adenosyltransferase